MVGCFDSAREQLGSTLGEARRLFEEGGDSDSWFALSAQLSAHAVRFASATYQLSEWPKPDDARADLDEPISLSDPHLPHAVAGSASARSPNEAVCGCETWRPSVPARERRCDQAIPTATTEPAPLVPSAAPRLRLVAKWPAPYRKAGRRLRPVLQLGRAVDRAVDISLGLSRVRHSSLASSVNGQKRKRS